MTNLGNYLNTKGIQAVAGDPNFSEPRVKQRLLSAQWLVLLLTPEAISSPQVQSLVNTAFERVGQGDMQGVLALTFSSNPVELEEMPPLWSTIRIYYAGERNEDHQQAFEKLSRTLSYTRVPVPATSSSTNNWASSFSSVASRPLPAIPQPARRSHSRMVIPVVAALILIILFLAFTLGNSWISNLLTMSKPNVQATVAGNNISAATAHANASATAYANATATALSQQLTPTPQDVYNKAIKKKLPDFVINAQDNKQKWDQNASCTFIDNTYQISNTVPDQYTRCMANSINLKNFAYQVKLTVLSDGDAGGLIFRADLSHNIFYRLSLDSQGTYTLFLCQPCIDTSTSGGTTVKQGSIDSINGIGQPNTLTVIVLNNAIYLYVNSIFVMKLDGSAITNSGKIGLFAVSQNQSTNVTFSEVKVWKLPDSGQLQ